MKIFIKVVSFIVLATMLNAENPTKSIISIEYGSGTITQTYGSTLTQDDKNIEKYGLKIGAVSDVKRLFLSYRSEKIANTSQETKGYSFSIDYEGLATENGSGLFAGLIVGYGNYDFISYDSTALTQADFFFGFDIGATVLLAGTYGFDIGYRYTLPLSSDNSDYKISDSSTTYFGFNYHY